MVTSRPYPLQYPVELAHGLVLEGTVRQVDAGQDLYTEGDTADRVYKVLTGAIRVARILPDGRRHIVGFYLPGDIMGLDEGAVHDFSAEAVAPSRVAAVTRSAVQALAAADQDAMVALWRLLAQENRREREHALMLGRMTALERVSSFLATFAARSPSPELELPMSRADIADYLGLTIETVSRTMTLLRQRGRIKLRGARQVELSGSAMAA